MNRIVRASDIHDVRVVWCDDEGVDVEVTSSSSPTKKYTVSYYGDFWRCTCKDFEVHFKRTYGSFMCKHIMATIRFLLETGQYRITQQEKVFA